MGTLQVPTQLCGYLTHLSDVPNTWLLADHSYTCTKAWFQILLQLIVNSGQELGQWLFIFHHAAWLTVFLPNRRPGECATKVGTLEKCMPNFMNKSFICFKLVHVNTNCQAFKYLTSSKIKSVGILMKKVTKQLTSCMHLQAPKEVVGLNGTPSKAVSWLQNIWLFLFVRFIWFYLCNRTALRDRGIQFQLGVLVCSLPMKIRRLACDTGPCLPHHNLDENGGTHSLCFHERWFLTK